MTPPTGARAAVDVSSGTSSMELDPSMKVLVEAVAHRTAALVLEQLRPVPSVAGDLVDVAAVAAALGVGTAYVYEHADELGVERIGNGPRPRLRFDLGAILERLEPAAFPLGGRGSQTLGGAAQSGDGASSGGRRRRRLPDTRDGLPVPGSVLRSRGGL